MRFRITCLALAGLLSACTGDVGSSPLGTDTLVLGTHVQVMPLRTGLIHPRPPATPNLTYYGGPVLGQTKIVEVLWGPNVQFSTKLGTFYSAVAGSEYFDLLGEYRTPTQSIARGSFLGLVIDGAASSAAIIDDTAIQTELARLIHDGVVPANDENTFYAVHFPAGVTITQNDASSCVDFCAYHGTFKRNDKYVAYAVIPDMGGACAASCGSAPPFDNTTWAASHELAEVVTDPAVGFAGGDPAAPLAWFDPDSGELADACQGTAQIAGYVVQTQWSAKDGRCRFGSSSTGNFVVGLSPSTQAVKAGTSATMLVGTTQTGPSASTIALSMGSLPEGVTATFDPPTVMAGQQSVLTLAAAMTAPSVSADVIVVGMAGGETENATARLNVDGTKPANDFTLGATPVTQTVQIGSSVPFMVQTALASGTAETVTLSAGGLPSGVTATFTPPMVTAGGSAMMVVNATGGATPGSALLTITGTARSRTHTTSVSLDVAVVPPANDFKLTVMPASQTVVGGQSTTYTVSTVVSSGSAQPIALSVSGLPTGVSGSFSPLTVSAGQTTTLTLTAAADAPAASGPFTITGTAASGTHTTTASVTVTPAPPADDFSIALGPSSRSVQAGSSTTFTVTTAVTSGSAVDIAFAISGLPNGVTASFQPTSVTAGQSSTLTIVAALSATVGSAQLTVTGSSSTGSHTANASVSVTAPPPLAIDPPSATMPAGSMTTFTVATSVTSGSPQSLTLAVSGLPDGVTGAFTPPTVTEGGSATLTVTAAAGASAGTSTFTVTGTGTSGTRMATAELTVTAGPTNLVLNGDFEDGLLDHWTVSQGNVTNVNINPHGGAQSVKVGRSSGVDARSVIYQAFAVPATGTTTLDFWWYPRCEDTANTQYVSIFRNDVLDQDLIATCSNDSVYEEKTFDLSSYAGKTIQLVFEVDIDFFATGSAWFYVDDVVVTNRP